MLRWLLFLVLIDPFKSSVMSQSIKGVYALKGIHEMAAAFEFREDGRFSFYYVYGAVDRNAEGSFTVEGSKIILKSDKEPGKDFTVTHQNKQAGPYRIQLSAPNPYLLQNVLVVSFKGDQPTQYYTDQTGLVEINEPTIDSLFLQHSMFPDILTKIKDGSNHNNQFEVELNLSLMQVSFKGIDLEIVGNELHCLPNYFMPFDHIRFVKEP